MHTMFHSDKSHLFVGPEANHQGTTALNAILPFVSFDCPNFVVALVDSDAEGMQVREYADYWLRAVGYTPIKAKAIAQRFFAWVPKFKEYPISELAKVVQNTRVAQATELLRISNLPWPPEKAGILTVFYAGAERMLPSEPDDTILLRVLDLLPYLPPHSSIVATAHTGSPYLPKQSLGNYSADYVFQIAAPGVEFKVQVTQVKPNREKPFLLEGRQHDGGVITLTEKETENV